MSWAITCTIYLDADSFNEIYKGFALELWSYYNNRYDGSVIINIPYNTWLMQNDLYINSSYYMQEPLLGDQQTLFRVKKERIWPHEPLVRFCLKNHNMKAWLVRFVGFDIYDYYK